MNHAEVNILIVDDASANGRMLIDILKAEDYTVQTVRKGSLALSYAQITSPNLILLDTVLPDIDGYRVCARLKADDRTRDIPVIFVSPTNELSSKIKAFEVGGVDYLTEPFQAEEILARVRTHLELRQMQTQLETQNLLLQEENTRRKRIQEALKDSRERYRLLAEHSTDMISRQNVQGIYLYVSPACRTLLGYEIEEIVSHFVFEFIHPEDLPTVRTIYANPAEQTSISTLTYRARRKDNSYIWLETTNKIVRDPIKYFVTEIITVSRDVTERKQAEVTLQEAHAELEARVEELSALNLIIQTVAITTDLNSVLQIVTNMIAQLFHVPAVTISLFDAGQTELTVIGQNEQPGETPDAMGRTIPLRNDLSNYQLVREGQSIVISAPHTNPGLASLHALIRDRKIKRIMMAPLLSRGEVLGVMSLATNRAKREFTVTDMQLAETIAGQIAGAIENTRLFREQQEANAALSAANRRMQDELALAHDIQYSLLPAPNPGWPDLDVVCYTTPVREVGGDFYNYHAFEDQRVILMVGDVSGKGVSAALLMATSLAQFDASLSLDFTPAERFAYLDKFIEPYTKPRGQNCAMCCVEIVAIDAGRPVLKAANAGCIPPYIKRAAGPVEWSEIGGFALGQGLGAEVGYQEIQVELVRGDIIVLTSDGVVEAFNETGEMFGFERLEQAVRSGPQSGAKLMLEHLHSEVAAFVGDTELYDDLTIVVVQV